MGKYAHERFVDDTDSIIIRIKDGNGRVLPITGFTFRLSVDPAENPTDDLSQLFQSVGSILDAGCGEVEFAISAANANQTPGVYYYDIQMVDTAFKVKTLFKDTFTFLEDITKETS